MMPEVGNALLCLALGIALLLTCYPLWGVARGDARLMGFSRLLAGLQFAAVLSAFVILAHAFVVNDFTVAYVVHNSNTALPVWYRVAATWGAHEGSLLLWMLLLSNWTFAVALFSKAVPQDIAARVLAVMGMISIGFLLFILLTSNPFTRTLPDFPLEGNDLNPLLQDPGLIFHPPLLYMGYVGFSVAFAFAIAALLRGSLDAALLRFARPWTLAAWIFLTCGIILGSFWAYYELGWGGWWFWDPVENASLMPWLVGTALIHSLAVAEKRGSFKAWCLLLAICAFSLCLLGTFLVRSGVLISVHTFASDPARGMFILAFMVVVTGGALLLFALRGGLIRSTVNNSLWSRESLLLGNNILLMAGMLVVLLGTLLPLVHKQLGLGSISIGEPFFNTLFTALMVPFSLMCGVAPLVKWGRDNITKLAMKIGIAAGITLLAALLLPWLIGKRLEATAVTGVMMAVWVAWLTLTEVRLRAAHRSTLLSGLRKISLSQWGMVLGHVGLAVTVFGIAISQSYSIERDVRMKQGDSLEMAGYHFTLNQMLSVQGPNYSGVLVMLAVSREGKTVTTLQAEKRSYPNSRVVLTETAIDGGLTRDLYVAPGEPLDNGYWAMRLYYKPFVRWIWSGGLMMAFGGLCALLSRRNRRTSESRGQQHEI